MVQLTGRQLKTTRNIQNKKLQHRSRHTARSVWV